ncbi:MAG: hypothetical protein ABFS34_09425 [Gemmatimonadota bacterium]
MKRLLRELHRRSLWQVLLIYATGSWIVYQVALDLAEGLGLPDWVAPTALILLLVGLPIVLATAFLQEGSPATDEPPTPAAQAGGATAQAAPAPPAAAGQPPAPESSPRSLSRHLTWRNAILSGLGAFALLGIVVALFMASRLVGIGPAATLFAQGALAEDARIILADFDGPPADSAIAEMVTEALRIDLEQSRVVRLVEPRVVRDALARMQRDEATRIDANVANEVALREGIPAVLAGELLRAGGSVVISARIVAPGGGGSLASFRATAGDSTELVDAVDQLSADMRAKIGESLSSVRGSPPLERVTTRSLPALQRYSSAVRILQDAPESTRATALLEEAVAADSAFAMAWIQLGRLHFFQDVDDDRATDALERARRHAERLSPRERLLAEVWYQDDVEFDRDARYAALQRLLAEYPDDREGLLNLFYYRLERMELPRAREALDRVLAVGSAWALGSDIRWQLSAYEGNVEAAAAELDAYAARFPSDSLYTANIRAYLAAMTGDYEAASRGWLRLRESSSGTVYEAGSLSRLGNIASLQGRLAEAFRLNQEADRAAGLNPVQIRLGDELFRLRRRAWLELPVAEEVDALRASLAAGFLDSIPASWAWELDVAPALALAGATDDAERVLESWLDRASERYRRRDRDEWANARGEIAFARGEYEAALESFQEAREYVEQCPRCGLVDIGRAHEALGRPDSARVAYESYLRTPDPFRIRGDAVARAITLERLAGLHLAAGDRDAARAALAEFIDLWKDADPELQPRVDAARHRLQSLVEAER